MLRTRKCFTAFLDHKSKHIFFFFDSANLPHYTIIDHFCLNYACSFRLSALKWHPDKHQGASQVS
jgi:hypothetical protein